MRLRVCWCAGCRSKLAIKLEGACPQVPGARVDAGPDRIGGHQRTNGETVEERRCTAEPSLDRARGGAEACPGIAKREVWRRCFQRLKAKLASASASDMLSDIANVQGIKVLAKQVDRYCELDV